MPPSPKPSKKSAEFKVPALVVAAVVGGFVVDKFACNSSILLLFTERSFVSTIDPSTVLHWRNTKKSYFRMLQTSDDCYLDQQLLHRRQEQGDGRPVEGLVKCFHTELRVGIEHSLNDNARAEQQNQGHPHEVDKVHGDHQLEPVEQRAERGRYGQMDGEEAIVEVEQSQTEYHLDRVGRYQMGMTVVDENTTEHVDSEEEHQPYDLEHLEEHGHRGVPLIEHKASIQLFNEHQN